MAEALRTLSVARRSAVKAKTQAVNQLRALLISAPSSLRGLVLKVKPEHCVAACAALQADDEKNAVMASLKTTLRLLARRWNALHEELRMRGRYGNVTTSAAAAMSSSSQVISGRTTPRARRAVKKLNTTVSTANAGAP